MNTFFVKKICKFANGTDVQPSTNDINRKPIHGLGRYVCPWQNFRSCADIKIVKSPSDTSAYKPNPVPELPVFPSTFQCFTAKGLWQGAIDRVTANPNNSPDPYKFKNDSALSCFINTNSGINQAYSTCETCRLNCMTADKVCPTNCLCRW